jgi:hypothetical protein
VLKAGQIEPGDANGDREVRAMPALPSTGDRPEEERAPSGSSSSWTWICCRTTPPRRCVVSSGSGRPGFLRWT